jgi:hypothetical protein
MSIRQWAMGFWPTARDDLDYLEMMGRLPYIRGTWYIVDPTSGSSVGGGKTMTSAVASIEQAYAKCISGAGDGIIVISRGTGTSSQTTSYLTQELVWDKHGITVVGISAPVKSYQRARIANKTIVTTAALTVPTAGTTITRAAGSFITDGWVAGMKGTCAGAHTDTFVVASVSALTLTLVGTVTASAGLVTSITSYNINLLTVSGSNNAFYNLMFWNGGTDAKEIGGVVVSGHRNYFGRCHIVGGAGAASAATKYSLKLDAAQDNTFEGGTIGSDTFAHGDHADSESRLSGSVARNRFAGVEVLSYVTDGTAHAGVKSSATSGGAPTVFTGCLFNSLFSVTTPAAAHITSGAVDKVLFDECRAANFTAWGGYATMPTTAASAGGGIATTA